MVISKNPTYCICCVPPGPYDWYGSFKGGPSYASGGEKTSLFFRTPTVPSWNQPVTALNFWSSLDHDPPWGISYNGQAGKPNEAYLKTTCGIHGGPHVWVTRQGNEDHPEASLGPNKLSATYNWSTGSSGEIEDGGVIDGLTSEDGAYDVDSGKLTTTTDSATLNATLYTSLTSIDDAYNYLIRVIARKDECSNLNVYFTKLDSGDNAVLLSIDLENGVAYGGGLAYNVECNPIFNNDGSELWFIATCFFVISPPFTSGPGGVVAVQLADSSFGAYAGNDGDGAYVAKVQLYAFDGYFPGMDVSKLDCGSQTVTNFHYPRRSQDVLFPGYPLWIINDFLSGMPRELSEHGVIENAFPSRYGAPLYAPNALDGSAGVVQVVGALAHSACPYRALATAFPGGLDDFAATGILQSSGPSGLFVLIAAGSTDELVAPSENIAEYYDAVISPRMQLQVTWSGGAPTYKRGLLPPKHLLESPRRAEKLTDYGGDLVLHEDGDYWYIETPPGDLQGAGQAWLAGASPHGDGNVWSVQNPTIKLHANENDPIKQDEYEQTPETCPIVEKTSTHSCTLRLGSVGASSPGVNIGGVRRYEVNLSVLTFGGTEIYTATKTCTFAVMQPAIMMLDKNLQVPDEDTIGTNFPDRPFPIGFLSPPVEKSPMCDPCYFASVHLIWHDSIGADGCCYFVSGEANIDILEGGPLSPYAGVLNPDGIYNRVSYDCWVHVHRNGASLLKEKVWRLVDILPGESGSNFQAWCSTVGMARTENGTQYPVWTEALWETAPTENEPGVSYGWRLHGNGWTYDLDRRIDPTYYATGGRSPEFVQSSDRFIYIVDLPVCDPRMGSSPLEAGGYGTKWAISHDGTVWWPIRIDHETDPSQYVDEDLTIDVPFTAPYSDCIKDSSIPLCPEKTRWPDRRGLWWDMDSAFPGTPLSGWVGKDDATYGTNGGPDGQYLLEVASFDASGHVSSSMNVEISYPVSIPAKQTDKYRVQVVAKAGANARWLRLLWDDFKGTGSDAYCWLDTQGSGGFGASSGIDSTSIGASGGGYVEFTMILSRANITDADAGVAMRIVSGNSASSYSGDDGDGIYIKRVTIQRSCNPAMLGD